MKNYWEIKEGKVDSTDFFRLLLKYFPDATTFFVEGGDQVAEDVVQLYRNYIQEGDYLPEVGTIWPKSQKFRCRFSPDFVHSLTQLTENHAAPELLDHFALYKNRELLLVFYDAFSNSIELAHTIPEMVVASFAQELKLPYRLVSDKGSGPWKKTS